VSTIDQAKVRVSTIVGKQAKVWVSTIDQAKIRVSIGVPPDRNAGKGLGVYTRSGGGAGVHNRRQAGKAWVSTLDQAKMRVSRIVVGVQQPALCVSEALRAVVALNSFCDPGPADWIWTRSGWVLFFFFVSYGFCVPFWFPIHRLRRSCL